MAGGALLAAALGALLMLRPGGDDAAASEIVYQARCAYCHDLDGAIGVKLDERVIRFYGSALGHRQTGQKIADWQRCGFRPLGPDR